MEWLQITVSTTSEGADLVAMILSDCGSEGVTIKDNADVRELIDKKLNWDYVDDNLVCATDGVALVSGFFHTDFDCAIIHTSLENLKRNSDFALGSLETMVTKIDSADWENEWRKYYKPIVIGKVVIVPAWQEAPDNADIPVFIEPGMAFGTGNHETTSMCIELMQKLDLRTKTVLDMGCGSGILGITAVKCGAKNVILSDIDPQATDAAKRNAELNGVVSSCKVVCGDLDTGAVEADITVANITADILIRLESALLSALKPYGYAVISGIINSRAVEVEKAYSSDFDVLEIRRNGEWQAMLLRRRG